MRRTVGSIVTMLAACGLAACSNEPATTAPTALGNRASDAASAITPRSIRQLAAQRGIYPLPPAPRVRPELVRLGQALAFDKILSGNRDISCTTCHLPAYETGDGKSISVGAGGVGLGPTREHPQGTFIPRNAPPWFNLYAMKHLFWDGRVEVDPHGHFHTPAGAQLTPAMQRVLAYGPVSALGMFPVVSRTEMRGQSGNELAALPDTAYQQIWAGIMRRLGRIPQYRAMFEAAYPGTRFRNMTFAHASNAIGAFITARLRYANSPWDRFLAGDDRALTPAQLDAAQTFLTLKCSLCHNGATFSDEQFHDVAVAQIGPGEGNGAGGHDDFGRMNVTGDPADRYRFRTSPLRNVELTGPYGHDGAILTLRGFVDHYSESDQKLLEYDPSQLESALQPTVVANAADILAQRDTIINGVVLTPDVVDKLVTYMQALTDPAARNLRALTPRRVPSGLPVDNP